MTALLPRELPTFLPHFVSQGPEVQFFRDGMATLGVGDQVGETLPVFPNLREPLNALDFVHFTILNCSAAESTEKCAKFKVLDA
jgi:hypothetical protein